MHTNHSKRVDQAQGGDFFLSTIDNPILNSVISTKKYLRKK